MSKQTTREKLAAQLHGWSVPATVDVLLDCADHLAECREREIAAFVEGARWCNGDYASDDMVRERAEAEAERR